MPKKRILLRKEYELLIPFVRFPWRKYTFKDIKRLCKKSSESYVYNVLKSFVKERILQQENVGNSIVYYLDLNHKTQSFIGFIAEYVAFNSKNLPFDVIGKIMKKIPGAYFTLLITGSHASGKNSEESDLDLVIIFDDTQDIRRMTAELHMTAELSIPKVHLYIFKKSEFLEMLLNNQANYGKEISKNNKLIYGAANYYNIINEAVTNGFNDKKLS